MSDHHRHHHKSDRKSRSHSSGFSDGKNFIILPIVFCILIYLVCGMVILPSTSSYLSMANIFFSDKEKSFTKEHKNIFVPVEDTSRSPENPDKPDIVKASSFIFPSYEDQFGELIIDDCQIKADLYFGDSWYVLGNGVGIYNGSAIPGYGRTILIAGHNNTYFNGLKYAKEGQIVKIRTNYGNYQYEITGTKITDNEDRSAYDLAKNEENLIMYTCYPFDTLGLTNLRAFIYAKYVSGPVIDKTS